MKLEHEAHYILATGFFHEISIVPLTARSIEEATGKMPKLAYGFSLLDVEIRSGTLEDGSAIEDRKTVNESPIYFPGGIPYTLDLVEREHGKNSALAWNMRTNKWSFVVKTIMGTYQPMDSLSQIVPR